jgi:alpha-galactosidase
MQPFVLLAAVVVFLGLTSALNNGLARTPQMGWNSWNWFGCSINETIFRATAQAIVDTGLAKAGYQYVNLDDCWAGSRDSSGILHEDPVSFPSGIKALSAFVHSLGLKFGLYSDAGFQTCAGRPGSLGYEKNDANLWASWEVDYMKYDNCYTDGTKPEVRYPVMRDALNATGRPILYSMCEANYDAEYSWAPAVGNSWRTTNDINDHWDSMVFNLDQNDEGWKYAAPGGWNDPDMLEVGNGGMNSSEYQAHFSLWALVKSPLIVGCDVTKISADALRILTNTEVIGVNQDPLGVQGHKISNASGLEVWAGPLVDGAVAAVLFNRSPVRSAISFTFSSVGLTFQVAAVRDLWAHEDLGIFFNEFTASVDPHAAVMVKLTDPTKKALHGLSIRSKSSQ